MTHKRESHRSSGQQWHHENKSWASCTAIPKWLHSGGGKCLACLITEPLHDITDFIFTPAPGTGDDLFQS